MTLTGHEDPVTLIAYSRTGRHIASGSGTGSLGYQGVDREYTVRVWETRTGEEPMTPMRVGHFRICAISFILNDTVTRIAVCTADGILRIRNISTGHDDEYRLCEGPSTHHIRCAAFSPDGTVVATGLPEETVYIWSTSTGGRIFALQGPQSQITGIAFSSNGRLTATFSRPISILTWDSRTGRAVGSLLVIKDSMSAIWVRSFAISPDGNTLAVCLSESDQIELWDLETQKQVTMPFGKGVISSSLVFSPDGLHLAAVTRDRVLSWDLRAKQEPTTSLNGHSVRINSITYSPDGVYIASASSDRTIRIWNAGSIATAGQPLHPSQITSAALAPDNTFIACNSKDGSVRIWDAQNDPPRQLHRLVHEEEVACVAISPNGHLIASASGSKRSSPEQVPKNHMIQLWNTQSGEPIDKPLEAPGGVIKAMCFSPDMSQLASISLASSPQTTDIVTVHVWSLATRTSTIFGTFDQETSLLSRYSCLQISFSRDGRLLAAAVGGVGEVHIWRTCSSQPLGAPLQTSEYSVFFLAFSYDDTKVVTGTIEGTFRVSDILRGHVICVHTDDLTPVPGVSFLPRCIWVGRSPNERFAVRISKEIEDIQTMRLWDETVPGVVTKVRINRVRDGASAAFSTDSQSIIIGGEDKIMVWQIEAICSLAAEPQCDPLAQLLRVGLQDDGWVKGPSGELLLWIPSEYRDYVQLPPCTRMLSKHRVAISSDATGLRYGADWTSCWRVGHTE